MAFSFEGGNLIIIFCGRVSIKLFKLQQLIKRIMTVMKRKTDGGNLLRKFIFQKKIKLKIKIKIGHLWI